MSRLRRTFAWMLIVSGGFILFSLAVTAVVDRPEGSKPLGLKSLLGAGFMLGVCPIFLGCLLRREPPARTTGRENLQATTPTAAAPASVAVPLTAVATDPQAIPCTVTLTQRDLIRFHYWLFRRRLWLFFLIYVAAILLVTFIQLQSPNLRVDRLVFMIPGSLLVAGILACSPYWAGRKEFRRTPALQKPTRYEFSTAGFRQRTDDSDAICGWTTIPEAHESTVAVLLMVQPGLFYILPASAFTADDLLRFRQLLSEQLGDRWHPLTTSPAHPT